MNKNLEQKLASIVEKAIQIAEETGEFVVEQAPLLLQEFYLYKTVEHSFYVLLYFTLFAMLFLPVFFKRYRDHLEDTNTEPLYVLNIFALLFLAPLSHQLLNLLKITLAPKLYLLEYFLR